MGSRDSLSINQIISNTQTLTCFRPEFPPAIGDEADALMGEKKKIETNETPLGRPRVPLDGSKRAPGEVAGAKTTRIIGAFGHSTCYCSRRMTRGDNAITVHFGFGFRFGGFLMA